MNPIDLQKFCSKSRFGLLLPFTHGDRTYATDGRVIVSVPAVEGVITRTDAPGEDKIIALWSEVPDLISDWQPLPSFPPPVLETCEECYGTGRFYYGETESVQCEDCDGTGKFELITPVVLGNKKLNDHYLALISPLPGLLVAPSVTPPLEKMPFKFDDGYGLLMPLQPDSKPTARHVRK